MGQWVGSGHITKNQINLALIEIIQFCLKIYDGSMGRLKSNHSKSNKFKSHQDN